MNGHFASAWENVVFKYPHKTALNGQDRHLTYKQLDLSARQVATWLSKQRVCGKCVLILMDDAIDSIACMFGVLLSGNYYFYLQESEATSFFSDYLPYINLGAVVKDSHFLPDAGVPELVWGEQKTDGNVFGRPHSFTPYFAVFSTSGSTGTPKLVRHSADFILKDSLSQIDLLCITPNDRRDYGGSLMFSASLGAIFPTLLAGAALTLHPVMRTDVFGLPDYWRKAGITLTSVPVSVLRTLAKSDIPLHHLERLRLIIVTAETASREDMALFAARLPAHVMLMNGYATTETRGICIQKHLPADIDMVALHTVGRPVSGKTVHILGEQGESLPAGESGEIVVEAADLPAEYLNDVPSGRHSFFQSSRGIPCFRTGDVGYMTAEGYLVLEGRKDAVVKINGIKVNLQEAEKRLLQYPGVREVAVLMGDSTRIHAYYVAGEGTTASALHTWLGKELSPLHLPAKWTAMKQLPKTATGKIDRAKLKAGSAVPDAASAKDENAGPDDFIHLIRKVWKRELELSEEIGSNDDFFKDLGGNSLLAAVCVHEIEELTGMTLPPGAGNTYSTPALLSEFLNGIYDRPAHCLPIGDFRTQRPSLYLVPPLPGDRRTYYDLETRLEGAYNLFFLYYNPIDRSGNILPLSVLTDAMADQVTATGEVHLFGFSFGGIMAYLLAMKLEERNQTVNFLELLDTPLYSKLTGVERAYNLSVRTLRKIGQFVQAPAASWDRYIRHFSTAYKAYRENFTPEKHREDPRHPSQVIWRYSQSFPTYRPLSADIVLFTASERGGAYVFKQDFAWRRYTRKALRTIVLKGWHADLLISKENLDTIRDTFLSLSQPGSLPELPSA